MKNIRLEIRTKAGHLVTGPGDYVMLKTLTERILNATVTKLFTYNYNYMYRGDTC
jgi:hypothetical protein